jgi:hypothetical protein
MEYGMFLYKLRVYKSELHTVKLIIINYPALLKLLVQDVQVIDKFTI